MNKKDIYQKNVQLQTVICRIIHDCQVQNYDKAVRNFSYVTAELTNILGVVLGETDFYNQELEIVNAQTVNTFLQEIMVAQENNDYVLFADLLEIHMLPFLQSLQEAIRAYEGIEIDNNIWDNNMTALKGRNNTLWKQLLSYHDNYEKQNAEGTWSGRHHLEDTTSGAFTMAGQDEKGIYYYHSNVNPQTEAISFARYYYHPGSDAYVIWGLGLGYHVREMMALDDDITLTVYESNLDVIYHYLMIQDASYCLELPGFSIIYDPDFKQIVKELEHTSDNFIIHYPSLRHIENKQIREQMELFFIKDSGKRNVAALFESNSRENFKCYDGYVDQLEAEFSGKDVVIVAAGPSLDKNIELLKNKKENMVILAVETVFRKLLNLGIDVDYMIVTDANSRIYGHIAGLEQEQVPMLYLSTAYKGYAMNYQGKKYLICQNGYDKAEEVAKKNGWHLYETGGSVSTTALDVCVNLGCKSIAFVGLDLAYTNNLAHAQGASRREAGDTKSMKQVPAIGGGTVPVSRLFIIYNTWIANRVKGKDVTMPVIDATEGGAIIPGLEIMTLEEYMRTVKDSKNGSDM